MLTKKDRQQLIVDFKEVFATKDDLKNLATKNDLKRFVTKDDLDKKLAKQSDHIITSLATYIHDSILKYLAEQDTRIEKIEKHIGMTSSSSAV